MTIVVDAAPAQPYAAGRIAGRRVGLMGAGSAPPFVLLRGAFESAVAKQGRRVHA